jgi:hypothetical protein
MVCGTSSSADAPAPHLRRKTSFCASSSPSTGNETSSHGAPPVPHVCYDLARLLVRLAAGVGRGATRDFDPLALPGVPNVLAVDIAIWTAPIPADLQALIRRMARESPTWGEERITNELWLKLGLQVSPRTVRKYLPKHVDHGQGPHVPSQRWRMFVHNHAQAIVACDFCVVVTATFRLLYVFVLMEHATRRILHVNVTAHPTALWALQQLRDAIPSDHAYRFLIHDHDSIFSH